MLIFLINILFAKLFYPQMDSKLGNLAKAVPQLWDNKMGLESLRQCRRGSKALGVLSGAKNQMLYRSLQTKNLRSLFAISQFLNHSRYKLIFVLV